MTTQGRQGVMGLRRVGALGARRPSGTLGVAVGEAGVNCRGLATTALQKVPHAPAEISLHHAWHLHGIPGHVEARALWSMYRLRLLWLRLYSDA